jgi:hypothetical protein
VILGPGYDGGPAAGPGGRGSAQRTGTGRARILSRYRGRPPPGMHPGERRRYRPAGQPRVRSGRLVTHTEYRHPSSPRTGSAGRPGAGAVPAAAAVSPPADTGSTCPLCPFSCHGPLRAAINESAARCAGRPRPRYGTSSAICTPTSRQASGSPFAVTVQQAAERLAGPWPGRPVSRHGAQEPGCARGGSSHHRAQAHAHDQHDRDRGAYPRQHPGGVDRNHAAAEAG